MWTKSMAKSIAALPGIPYMSGMFPPHLESKAVGRPRIGDIVCHTRKKDLDENKLCSMARRSKVAELTYILEGRFGVSCRCAGAPAVEIDTKNRSFFRHGLSDADLSIFLMEKDHG